MSAERQKEQGAIITPILEKLVKILLIVKPDDPIPYMIQYLEDSTGKGARPLSKKETAELAKLRRQYAKLKEKLGEQHETEDVKMVEEHSSSDEAEYIDELPEVSQRKMTGPARTSVSAEAYGVYHK